MNLIIHHKDCPDGFCAAFVAKKRYPDAELLGAAYGEPPPFDAVRGKDVLVVDFSWRTREIVCELANRANSLTIYDHHKTAQEVLGGLPFATFDMNRSGATLTWDMLFGGKRPWYVNYVEDRDLWRWALPRTKEVSAFTMALPHTIEAWSRLDRMTWEQAADAGSGILMHINHYVEKAVAQRQMGSLDGHTVAVVNAQYMNISEVGGALNEIADVALGWFERGDGMIQGSLRSKGDLDVSVIAKRFGGGGHKNAAGFQVSLEMGRKIIDSVLGRNKITADAPFLEDGY